MGQSVGLRVFAGTTAFLLVVAATTLATAGARAGGDSTPPVWVKFPTASIALGAQLQTTNPCSTSWSLSSIEVNWSWLAKDAQSGVAFYEDIDPETGETDIGLQTSLTSNMIEFEPDCGGGEQGGAIRAVNGAGLVTANVDYYGDAVPLRVVEDKGYPESSMTDTLTYQGAWSNSRFTGWSRGTTEKTTRAGASVKLSTDLDKSSILAVVMPKGPDRGRAAIYLDGARVATVNTYSANRQHRLVVWRATAYAGQHTVRVVNLATPGHPRIDIDAFLVASRKGTVR